MPLQKLFIIFSMLLAGTFAYRNVSMTLRHFLF
jgi:hypothetical protein